MFYVLGQAESFPSETQLRPFYPPSLSKKKNRERQVLLQTRWPKISAGLLSTPQARGTQQKNGRDNRRKRGFRGVGGIERGP